MGKTEAQIVREVLDRMGAESNEEKAREITRILGRRIRRPTRGGDERRENAGAPRGVSPRYSPIRIEGEPISVTILRDRGVR